MAEGDAGPCPPQVFVVDRKACYVSMPGEAQPRWAKVGEKCLLPLVGLALLGLVVQGCFIYTLYQRSEEIPHCHNRSHPHTSGQEGDRLMSQKGPEDSNNIPGGTPHPNPFQWRPFAQLIGSNSPVGHNDVVLWEDRLGESVTHHMGYEDGKLLVEEDGYYYLYSKVTFNAADTCLFTQHKLMRNTTAYGQPIDLLRAKSYLCHHERRQERWNSFLSGIFFLQSGDKVFVTLKNVECIEKGNIDNVMGAFMIFPGSMIR